MSTDKNPSSSDPGRELRAAKRAQREADRAARAQRKADAARQRAVEAARAGGLFEGMETAPTSPASDPAAEAESTAKPDPATEPEYATASEPAATAGPAAVSYPPASDAADTSTSSNGVVSRWRELQSDPQRRRTVTKALALVSIVLVVIAGLATWGYVDAREETATEQSIADAPREATDAAREIATQMFTYDHQTVDEELAEVRSRLAEPALTEFVEQSLPNVAANAKENEATVFATVAAAATEEVTDWNDVTVLIMLNRMVSTKEAPEAAASASRLRLHMVNDEGEWKLAELNSL